MITILHGTEYILVYQTNVWLECTSKTLDTKLKLGYRIKVEIGIHRIGLGK